MPFPWAVILEVVGILFSVGVTWGVMTTRQVTSEEKSKVADNRIDSIVGDLKEAVGKLNGMATEFQVLKSSSVRYEKDLEDTRERVNNLEIQMAKRFARPKSR